MPKEKGPIFAGLIVTSFICLMGWSLTVESWAMAMAAIPILSFLYTGLFITAHDGFHGTIHSNSKVNSAITVFCLWLYASFRFDQLYAAHMQHHKHPGELEGDPDFYDHDHQSGFFGWYWCFMWRYLRFWQVIRMAIRFNVLVYLIGLDFERVLAVWALPAVLSTFQLFYFGTYLPHRKGADLDPEHAARTNNWNYLSSLLTCYHFGKHLEHHRYPHIPWWRLGSRVKA